jgi:hypothetical protein
MSAVTPTAEMTATVAAAMATPKVTTTVATTAVTTAVASSVATTAVATATCLGRHVGCGHHQTGGSRSRETIPSGQGSKGQ